MFSWARSVLVMVGSPIQLRIARTRTWLISRFLSSVHIRSARQTSLRILSLHDGGPSPFRRPTICRAVQSGGRERAEISLCLMGAHQPRFGLQILLGSKSGLFLNHHHPCSSLKVRKSRFATVAAEYASVSDAAVARVCARIAGSHRVQAEDDEERRVLKLMNDVQLITRQVPGSSGARLAMRNEVRALMYSKGMPSFFITINPFQQMSFFIVVQMA